MQVSVNEANTEHEVAEGYRCKRDGDRGFTEKVVLKWGGVGEIHQVNDRSLEWRKW